MTCIYEYRGYEIHEFDTEAEARAFFDSPDRGDGDRSLGWREYKHKWEVEIGHDPDNEDAYRASRQHEFGRVVRRGDNIPPVSDYAHWNEDAERIWYEENRYDMEHADEIIDEDWNEINEGW